MFLPGERGTVFWLSNTGSSAVIVEYMPTKVIAAATFQDLVNLCWGIRALVARHDEAC